MLVSLWVKHKHKNASLGLIISPFIQLLLCYFPCLQSFVLHMLTFKHVHMTEKLFLQETISWKSGFSNPLTWRLTNQLPGENLTVSHTQSCKVSSKRHESTAKETLFNVLLRWTCLSVNSRSLLQPLLLYRTLRSRGFPARQRSQRPTMTYCLLSRSHANDTSARSHPLNLSVLPMTKYWSRWSLFA